MLESLRLSPFWQTSFLVTLLFFVDRVSHSHGGFVSPSYHSFTTLQVGSLVVDVPARNYWTNPSLLDWVSPALVTSEVTRPARVSPLPFLPPFQSMETESLRVPFGIELYSPDDVGRARWWSASRRISFEWMTIIRHNKQFSTRETLISLLFSF